MDPKKKYCILFGGYKYLLYAYSGVYVRAYVRAGVPVYVGARARVRALACRYPL